MKKRCLLTIIASIPTVLIRLPCHGKGKKVYSFFNSVVNPENNAYLKLFNAGCGWRTLTCVLVYVYAYAIGYSYYRRGDLEV